MATAETTRKSGAERQREYRKRAKNHFHRLDIMVPKNVGRELMAIADFNKKSPGDIIASMIYRLANDKPKKAPTYQPRIIARIRPESQYFYQSPAKDGGWFPIDFHMPERAYHHDDTVCQGNSNVYRIKDLEIAIDTNHGPISLYAEYDRDLID